MMYPCLEMQVYCFCVGIFHSSFGLMKYPYTKTIHLHLQTTIHHSLVLVISLFMQNLSSSKGSIITCHFMDAVIFTYHICYIFGTDKCTKKYPICVKVEIPYHISSINCLPPSPIICVSLFLVNYIHLFQTSAMDI